VSRGDYFLHFTGSVSVPGGGTRATIEIPFRRTVGDPALHSVPLPAQRSADEPVAI